MHKVKLTVAALAVAGISAAGVGTALASSAPAKAPAPATAVAPATGDNVQQGDQNPPDTATYSPEKAGTEVADGSQQAGSETAIPEVSGPSDGPGGYQDPAGNVDTQSQGNN